LILGGIVALSFLGVAVTPENRVLDLHVRLTFFAFRVFPLVPLLLAIASWRDAQIPKRFAMGWITLTLVLAAYVVMLGWGPDLTTVEGLTTQVVSQKLVTILAVSILFVQSLEAERIAKRTQVIA
jgi:Na+/proline symporter